VLGGGQPNGAAVKPTAILSARLGERCPNLWQLEAEMMRREILLAVLMSGHFATLRCAQAPPEKLSSMSIEDLLNVRVTSVSRTEQKLSRTASAIYVITQEDIQRSGATNIPDTLRMVPGMDVGQINANTWAISLRGFNGLYSHGLLVMVDGRTVYTPSFGGVYWDQLDIPLEDIERIEVIRGPGGSVWGANAVNGVVNIITKKASQTKGGMIVAGGGNLDQGFGTLQYGGSVGKATDYRVYAKYFNESQLPGVTGADGGDGWNILRGGFRADSTVSAKDSLTFLGDLYTGREHVFAGYLPSVTSPGLLQIPAETPMNGGYVQMAWKRTHSARSDTTLQISYDQYNRGFLVTNEVRDSWDVDLTHHRAWGERQNVVVGLSYGYSANETNSTLFYSLPGSHFEMFSGFVEDEIAVIRNRLYLTAGTKLEHNNYTGFGAMPSIRGTWLPGAHQTVWAAVSRSVRTPSENEVASRVNFGGFIGPGGTPMLVSLFGNPNLADEEVTTYEFGYRTALSGQLSIDLAAYYGDTDHLVTYEHETSFFEVVPAPPHLVLPLIRGNRMQGESHGLEAFATWKVASRWTLSPGYAFEKIHIHLCSFTAPPAGNPSRVNTNSRRHSYSISPNSWNGRIALSMIIKRRLCSGSSGTIRLAMIWRA
jgi:iron complex outermembrane receptor protein